MRKLQSRMPQTVSSNLRESVSSLTRPSQKGSIENYPKELKIILFWGPKDLKMSALSGPSDTKEVGKLIWRLFGDFLWQPVAVFAHC